MLLKVIFESVHKFLGGSACLVFKSFELEDAPDLESVNSLQKL